MTIRKRTWKLHGQIRSAWRLDWADGAGRHQRQFPTKAEAELYRDKVIRERNAERYGTLVDETMTFERFTEVYDERKPWRTETYRERVKWSLRTLKNSFGSELRLTAITPTMVEEFTQKRLKDAATATVRQELATLSDVFKWAVRLRYAYSSPMKDIDRPELEVEKQDAPPEYMTPQQFGDLAGKADKDLPIYEFDVFTGLRASELLAVEWSDIKDGVVTVRLGKGRKQRVVPLVPQAITALGKVTPKLREPRVFWWVGDRFELYKRFRRRLKWAGMEGQFTFHALRHTFGAWASQSGVDLRVISAVMGHSSVRTTERLYAHLSPHYRRNELQKLGGLQIPRGTNPGQLTDIGASDSVNRS